MMSKIKGRLNSMQVVKSIFNAFALKQSPCSVREIQEVTGLPKSTLYKFLKELRSINFVSLSNKKYFIGEKIGAYGEIYANHNSKLQSIKKIASELSKETGLTAQICTLVQGKYMVLYEVVPETPNAIFSLVLARNVPITWTASGRLLLDVQSKEELWERLSEEDLQDFNGDTMSLEVFYNEIKEAHRINFSENRSLINDNCLCIASLVFQEESIRYTLCLSIKDEDVSSFKKTAIEALMRCSRKIQNALWK